jgi:hypothetical protein
MAWTKWHSPRTAAELESDEITMASYLGSQTQGFQSQTETRSISTSYGTFIREESNSLVFSDFGFLDVVPMGIEMRLRTRRVARIQDKTIQLWNGSRTISENLVNLAAEDDQIYGGADNRWGISVTESIPISSSQFGVVIDLQPHVNYPCSDLVLIRSVAMRLYLPDSSESDYVRDGYIEDYYV